MARTESITSNVISKLLSRLTGWNTEHLSKLTGTTTIIKNSDAIGTRVFRNSSLYDDAGSATASLTPDECQRMRRPRGRATIAYSRPKGHGILLRRVHPADQWTTASYFEENHSRPAAIPSPNAQ